MYRDLITTVNILLERCDGDVELAKEIIYVNFHDSGHYWREHTGMYSIIANRYFPDAKAKAMQRLELRQIEAGRDEFYAKTSGFKTAESVGVW